MVVSRANLKIALKDWVANREEPFKVADAQEIARRVAPNMGTYPNRIAQLLRGVGAEKLDSRRWIKTKPQTKD